MIKALKRWWNRREMYVIADARDNSVTLSRRLFERMGGYKMKCDKVVVFKCNGKYAFTNNHGLDSGGKTAMSTIQLNSKYKCLGFECNVPGLNRIFYEYGLPANISVKLSVDLDRTNNENPFEFYVLLPPKNSVLKKLYKQLDKK